MAIPQIVAMKKALLLLVSLTFCSLPLAVHGSRESGQKGQDLQRMVGQMLIVGFTGYTSKSPGFVKVLADLENGIVGGVLFLPHNIVRRAELEAMVRMIKQCACATVPFIAIDEEGGTVDRLGGGFRFPNTPSAAQVGKSSDADARKHYEALAKKLVDVGFNMNFAPVVDLNKNPRNPAIGAQARSFSADAAVVERYARIFIAEHRALGVLTALKHFPGHGSSTTDTHFAPTDVRLTWTDEELVPYRHLIQAGLVDAIMVGHLANDPRWGGTATQQGATAISHLLRRELGFQGVVISDDLTMRAVTIGKKSLGEVAISSIHGGVDLLLIGQPVVLGTESPGTYVNSAIMDAVATGDLTPQKIRDSWKRIWTLKLKLQTMQARLSEH
jgi:beta-N-acetylhexosaminidase